MIAQLTDEATSTSAVADLVHILSELPTPDTNSVTNWQTMIAVTAAFWARFEAPSSSPHGSKRDVYFSVPTVDHGCIPNLSDVELDLFDADPDLLARVLAHAEKHIWSPEYPPAWSEVSQIPATGYVAMVNKNANDIRNIPEDLHYRREDFPTTQSWLHAEYRYWLTTQLSPLQVWLDTSVQFGASLHEGLWLTVKLPQTVQNRLRDGDVWDAAMSWFDTGISREGVYATLPLVVLVALSRQPDNPPLVEWEAFTDHRVGDTIWQTFRSIVGQRNWFDAFAMYTQACAVVGANPNGSYPASLPSSNPQAGCLWQRPKKNSS